MNLLKFLYTTFGLHKQKEILRCMDKATIVIYDGENCLIANDIYIYYYVHGKKNTRSAYKFYKDNYKHMKDKLFYAHNLPAYKNRCMQVEGDLYQWLG